MMMHQLLHTKSDVIRQRNLYQMKRKYASQNPLEKQKYIEKVKRSKITRNNQRTINEQIQKYYETIQKIIQDGQVEKLKVDQYKIYLKKHGLGLSGNKATLIQRIKEHIECPTSVQRQWLLRAQMIPYESNGLTFYDPVCSEMHKLKKVPKCIHCGAERFEYEPCTFCCGNGKIKLASIEIPDELFELFTSQSEEAMSFQKNIFHLNCIFSFTSFGVKYDKELANAKNGVYTFRTQGMVYHNLPRLIPNENGPSYFQFYFFDIENEDEARLKILENSSLSEAIIKKLMKILEVNPYVKVFGRLKNYPSMEDVQLHISKDVNKNNKVCINRQQGDNAYQFCPYIFENWFKWVNKILVKEIK